MPIFPHRYREAHESVLSRYERRWQSSQKFRFRGRMLLMALVLLHRLI
jgi:hypothetical protein